MNFLVLVVSVLFYSDVFGESLPPVGQRLYIMENSTLFEPVEIVRDMDQDKPSINRVLKDSLSLGDAADMQRSEENIRRRKHKESKTAKLNFASMAVRGRISSPRLPFGAPVAPVGRADQALKLDLTRAVNKLGAEQELESRKSQSY